MNQTNIVFLSGQYEKELMSTYPDELRELVKNLVNKLSPSGLQLFNHGMIIGEEIIYNNHIFNIILKNPTS